MGAGVHKNSALARQLGSMPAGCRALVLTTPQPKLLGSSTTLWPPGMMRALGGWRCPFGTHVGEESREASGIFG